MTMQPARKTGVTPQANDTRALEAAAATRLLVAERILDYSGHVSIRIPGQDAFVIQIGSHSRAEVDPASMLVVDYDGNVLEGEGQPPSEIPIHIEILKARPDVQAVLHSHMELAIAFTMMEGVTLQPMRARASRWKSGIPTDPDPSHIKTTEQGQALAKTLGPRRGADLDHECVPARDARRDVAAVIEDPLLFQEAGRGGGLKHDPVDLVVGEGPGTGGLPGNLSKRHS